MHLRAKRQRARGAGLLPPGAGDPARGQGELMVVPRPWEWDLEHLLLFT